MVSKPVLHVSGDNVLIFLRNSVMTSRWGAAEERAPQPSIRTMATDWDEEELARRANMHDGPQPYNFVPARRERANYQELMAVKAN